MDNNLHISDKVKGIEILSFDHVELIRNKVGKNTFIDVGTLGVVFFPEFHRFVLFLGDWEYVLLKRIPIVSSSRTEMKHRFYNLPTYTGFYTLRFNKITHPEALQNFDTILAHYSKFSYYGEPAAVRQNEASPDASLIEEEAQPEIAVADRAPMTKSSSEMLVSEEAKPGKLKGAQKLKKGFAKLADKLRGGSRHQAGNYFMTQVMDIQSLTTAHGEFAPVEYFGRNEVEAGIVKSKDMASKMHFGVSPNEIQFINLTELRETIEHRIENINGEDVLISQSEADIIAEIEKERQFQEIERQKQQEHRDKELFYIQKERELRDEMRRVIEEHKMTKLQTTEQKFQIELDHRDDLILEQARIRENEKLEFERKEQALYDEIGRRLGELRAKDKLTEEEHLEFARREAELLEINKRREEERKQMMLEEQHLLKQACATEITLKEREKKLALAKAKFHEMERDLRMKQVGLNELRKKANLSADERVEIQRREEEIAKMIALQESERIALERQAIEIESNAEVFRAQIAERELLTEAERIVLIEKEKEIEAESQRVLAELRAKESLTEDERLEIERRQKELKRIAAVREAERLEFIKRKEELEIQAARREAELREKERFTEAERVELERIKAELQRETQLEENEQRKLQAKRNMLFEEAERRAAEIQRRANLTEAERLELIRKEEALEKEIEGKLAALRLKEILTEEDRADLEEEEKKLTKLKEFREIQIRTMGSQFEEVRKQEEKLLQKNNEMIQTERVMHKELTEMKKDLEKPSIAEISMNVASV